MSAPRTQCPSSSWHVVVPVKDTRHGKSRLASQAGLADPVRAKLNRAMADDTMEAVVEAVGAEHAWLVSPDPGLRARWSGIGVHVVDDPGTGLNDAIRSGLRALPRTGRRAVLLGDLPALRASDLVHALEAADGLGECFVPDATGTGTVLRCGGTFEPRFGRGSAQAHAADGATRLELALPRLRSDVDDPASLAAAIRLGVGAATALALGLDHAS